MTTVNPLVVDISPGGFAKLLAFVVFALAAIAAGNWIMSKGTGALSGLGGMLPGSAAQGTPSMTSYGRMS